MTVWCKRVLIVFGVALLLPSLGCGDDAGPAERAGRQIDESAEETAGALEDLGREVGEAADESKEAAEKVRDSFED